MKSQLIGRMARLENRKGATLASLRRRPLDELSDAELGRIIEADLGLAPGTALPLSDEELRRIANPEDRGTSHVG